jgi:DNA helicase-2/ATP-dependent DNA helicase PcrA
MSRLLDDLTPAQKEAVLHREGPLLVVAGAGSGKTRVITRRVAYLVEQGIAPRNILAITFTNKAAGEMRERIGQLLGTGSGSRSGGARESVTVSTFHSLCARLLRRWATKLGYEPGFAILDAADQRSAVREALIEISADAKLFPPPKVLAAMSRAKDRLELPQELAARAASRFENVAAKAYEVYQGLLKQRNAFDFDDLLGKTVELIRDHADAREALQDRFRYILIDEYQDTNHAQYQLATLLAKKHRNLNATGDPDQSIYGWRGADVGNILRFEKDYPEARVVLLEKNYRSSKTICRAANGLIKHNKRRKEKTLVTDNDEGEPLEIYVADNEAAEARFVARRIEDLIQRGIAHDEIAVFYRTNSLSRAIEQMLFERSVPFVVVGALSFYERKEVKDVLAYLRVLANPRDDASTLRVLQTPPRGVGKTSLQRLKAFAQAQGKSLFEALAFEEAIPDLPKKARAGFREVEALFDKLRSRLDDTAENLVRAVVEETNYLAYLQQEYPEEEERAGNIEALVAGAREFDDRARSELAERKAAPPIARTPAKEKPRKPQGTLFAEPDAVAAPAELIGAAEEDVLPPLQAGLQGFLEQVALLAEEEAARDEDTSAKVQLMTVHTAKGLEFEHVFLVGLEDGLFPNARALEEVDGLEEERRLAYVAITRARKSLHLSYTGERSRFGKTSYPAPSGFLFELPDDVFEAGKSPRSHQPYAAKASEQVWEDEDEGDPDPGFPADEGVADEGLAEVEGESRLWRRPLESSRKKPADTKPALFQQVAERARAGAPAGEDTLAAGDRVRHEHFGVGQILEVSGEGMRRRVKVRFLEFGEKNLVLQYARLVKVTP